MTEEDIRDLSVPIDWADVASAPTIFANHLMVQADQHEFYLCFCDVSPPFIGGDTEEARLASLKKIEAVKARPVAKIGISAERLEGIVTTLRQSLDKYRAVQRIVATQQPTEQIHKEGKDDSEPKAAG